MEYKILLADNDVMTITTSSETSLISVMNTICGVADDYLAKHEIIQCIGLKRLDSIIGRICTFMLKNMDNKNVMELASDEFGISKDHIRRIFKIKLGMTCNEVLIRLKIEHAKVLLRETTKKIYEISEAVGYTSVDYFTNVFKRSEGITPIQYRMNEGFLQNNTVKCRDCQVDKTRCQAL